MDEEWKSYARGIRKNKTIKKNAEINFLQRVTKVIEIRPRAQILMQFDTTSLSEMKIAEDYRITKQQKRQITRGNTEPDYTIDLHGYTLDEGYEVFKNTILYSIEMSYKSLIIITGKSKMRSIFSSWINQPEIRLYVKYFSYASEKCGGDGAFFVMLY